MKMTSVVFRVGGWQHVHSATRVAREQRPHSPGLLPALQDMKGLRRRATREAIAGPGRTWPTMRRQWEADRKTDRACDGKGQRKKKRSWLCL
jgi:hypothetical protein